MQEAIKYTISSNIHNTREKTTIQLFKHQLINYRLRECTNTRLSCAILQGNITETETHGEMQSEST